MFYKGMFCFFFGNICFAASFESGNSSVQFGLDSQVDLADVQELDLRIKNKAKEYCELMPILADVKDPFSKNLSGLEILKRLMFVEFTLKGCTVDEVFLIAVFNEKFASHKWIMEVIFERPILVFILQSEYPNRSMLSFALESINMLFSSKRVGSVKTFEEEINRFLKQFLKFMPLRGLGLLKDSFPRDAEANNLNNALVDCMLNIGSLYVEEQSQRQGEEKNVCLIRNKTQRKKNVQEKAL